MNHRIGLYDGLLVKDNHIAGVVNQGPRGIICHRASPAARAEAPDRLVEIEVERLEQMREVLKVDGEFDVMLLDNMDCPKMQIAVELRDKAQKRGKILVEASGGVTLETVRSIALTGVERIAVGAITHSAPALDISMGIEVQ